MIGGPLLLAITLSASAPTDSAASSAAAAPAPRSQLLLFIGEQLSFDSITCRIHEWPSRDQVDVPDAEDTLEEHSAGPAACTEDDLHYRARYRVRLAIEGKPAEIVEFLASGWTEHYATSRFALLYVLDSIEGPLLPTGLAIPVYPTIDGDWASCDNDPGSELLQFDTALIFGRTDGMSSFGISQRYPDADYAITGQSVYCLRGRRLPALIKSIDSDLDNLREEGFPHLPPLDVRDAHP